MQNQDHNNKEFHYLQEVIENTGEVLDDHSCTGKQRPWRKRRMETEGIAGSMHRLGLKGADFCAGCGTYLRFSECPNGHQRKLKSANFCRARLCPMCQWRRSLRIAADCRDVCHHAQVEHPGLRYVFLTLTLRNCAGADLSKTLDAMFDGWKRMNERREVRGAMEGWFRSLEVKHSRSRDDWHPHFHAILAMVPGYFAGNRNKAYIVQSRWCELWQESMRLDYAPSVDVRTVRPKKGGSDALMGAVSEAAKYTTKAGDLLFENDLERQDRVVKELARSVKGRRLAAYGGFLREVHRELKKKDADAEGVDLVHVDEAGHVSKGCTCEVCGSTLWEHLFRWMKDVRDYVG